MPMRVVDEGSGARRGHARDKGAAGRNRRNGMGGVAAPTGYAIVRALEFDAVPVDGGGFLELIDDFNFRRLAAG